MTCIIAIETATEACSAALLLEVNGKHSVYKRFQLAPREHTKLILPMLDEVLEEAKLKITDVDAIAFGRGPGAFTGLRISTGIAQGLALSVDKPTIAISSLMTMALAAQKTLVAQKNPASKNDQEFSIVVAIDARMGEVYWAEYKVADGQLKLMNDEQLAKPEELFNKTLSLAKSRTGAQAESTSIKNSVVLIGSGWDVYLEGFNEANEGKPVLSSIEYLPNKFPDAEEVSQLALLAFEKGEYQSVEEAQPVYLRNNVAEKSKKKV